MSDATLNDVVDRLDRLEAAIDRLTSALREVAAAPPRGARTAPARATSADAPVAAAPRAAPPEASDRPAPKVSGPPPIRVAPPTVRAEQPGAGSTAPGRPEEAKVFDPYWDRTDIEVPGAEATIDDILTRVFEALMYEDVEETWATLFKLTNSNQLQGPRSLDHFKAFSWHKARRTATEYLEDPSDASSYTISYTEPAEVTDETDRVKVFVRKPDGRLPAPVVFARDLRVDNAWRMTQMSL